MIMVAGVPLQLFLAAIFWFVLGVSLSGAWSHPRPNRELTMVLTPIVPDNPWI